MAARVSLFVTCIVDQFFPRIGLATAELLERLGYRVEFPEGQTCCGQPAFNTGYREQARQVARHFLEVFQAAEHIVSPSASCVSMVKNHYPELFNKEPEWQQRARSLAGRIWELSQFLTEVARLEDVGARLEGVAAYHDGCHALRELGVREAPRRLLARVRGLKLREMPGAEECCGFGGTFSVKFPEISGAMARRKIQALCESGVEYVISADASCLMQIQGALSRAALPVRTLHLAEVLASR